MKTATRFLFSVLRILFFSGCQQSTTSSDEFAALLPVHQQWDVAVK
ncbi:MAG: hypothetical protein OEW40_04675 [Cyclobacteriaceae bacterium]|jgi:hypothetical protein|nr:hypothetical protein [Cyclobacteriaceae bacterium]